MADLARLTVRLEAQNSQLLKKLDQANGRLERFEKRAKKSFGNFKKAAAAAFGAFSVTALVAGTRNFIQFADSIDKAAKAAGVTAGFLQELRFAGDQLGVTNQQVDEGFRRFTRRMGEFANSGAGPAAKAIESLGIQIRDTEGDFRGSERIFRDFARAMEGIESEAERAAIAAQIFGDDAGPKLRLLLDQGVEGVSRLRQEARDIGAVLSDDVIQNAVEANDSLAKLAAVLKVQLAEAFTTLAPIITDVGNAFVALAKKATLAFGDIDRLSGDLLIKKLENLESLREDAAERLRKAEAREKDNSFVGRFNRVFSRDVETFRQKVQELDEQILKAELALGKRNFDAAFGGSGSAIAAPATVAKEGIVNEKAITNEVDRITARLFPLQAAAEKFNKELKLIEQSELSSDKKVEAANRLKKAFADATGGNRTLQKEVKKTDKEIEKIGKGAIDMGFAFSSAFEEAVLGAEKFSDVLEGLARDIAQIALRTAVTAPLGQAVGQGIGGLLPGFAGGGTFTVGGSGGTDSQIVAFRASPGERVAVSTPGQQSGTTVNVVNNTSEPASVRRSNDATGNEVVNVLIGQVANDIASGGMVARAMQNSFGVRRQGILRT